MKQQNYHLLLKVIFFSPLVFSPCLLFSPPHQGSSSCTVHEQRSFERKAEEDDGKVSFWMADWFTLGPPLFCCCCFSSQPALWFERRTSKGAFSGHSEVSASVVVLHLNRWHPEDGHASVSKWRQTDWQTHWGVSRCLAVCPSTQPPACPHATLRYPHAAALL